MPDLGAVGGDDDRSARCDEEVVLDVVALVLMQMQDAARRAELASLVARHMREMNALLDGSGRPDPAPPAFLGPGSDASDLGDVPWGP